MRSLTSTDLFTSTAFLVAITNYRTQAEIRSCLTRPGDAVSPFRNVVFLASACRALTAPPGKRRASHPRDGTARRAREMTHPDQEKQRSLYLKKMRGDLRLKKPLFVPDLSKLGLQE